jgi:major type 1 subunit fimbrin (pilin)
MKKTLTSAALAAAFGLVALQASASDGQINFVGKIVDGTCVVTGGAGTDGATGNITVTLPTVQRTAFAAAGATAGDTPFTLIVKDNGGGKCVDGTKVSLHFDSASTPTQGGYTSAMVDSASGRLNNLTAAGQASNVQVALFDGNGDAINLWTSSGSPVATVTSGQATLNYVAKYYALAAAPGAGKVNSAVMYSLQYN